MVDMNAITKPPWSEPLSQALPQATWPSLSLLPSLPTPSFSSSLWIIFFEFWVGGFFFFGCCDPCLKELGMAFCYWFDLILGWIFFVGSWWWSWGLPWFSLILILILWVVVVAGVCGWGFWGFKKTTVWWWWQLAVVEVIWVLSFCFYLNFGIYYFIV